MHRGSAFRAHPGAQRLPRTTLRDAEDGVLPYLASQQEHWSRLYATDPLERLNIAQRPVGNKIERRTHVVGLSRT